MLLFRVVVFLVVAWLLSSKQNALGNVVDNNEPRACLVYNHGQVTDMAGHPASNVLFTSITADLQFFVTEKGLTFLFAKTSDSSSGSALLHRIDADLVGAHIQRDRIEFTEASSTATRNYFNALHPNGIRNVREYQAVRIREVYPGVDWLIRMTAQGMKYDFEVKPNADASVIKIKYYGAENIYLENGKLHVKCKLGELIEQPPHVTQGNATVPSAFQLSRDEVTFNISMYDSTKPLRIDPDMIWGTFYGGNLGDRFVAVTTDNGGNTYTTGFTASPNFPLFSAGAYYDNSFGAYGDIVIVKFNANMQVVWSTFYGGSDGIEQGCGIATDQNNNVYITGYTSTADFPTQNGGAFFDNTANGQSDGFLLKFDAASNLLFATYVGGSGNDELLDIAIDNANNVYLSGSTTSSDFPTQVSGISFFDNTNSMEDGALLKFSSGGALLWSTYFGGSTSDQVNSISIDANGNLFACGGTQSSDFPVLDAGTYFTGSVNGQDGFVAKFNVGLSLTWSTAYGGSGQDVALFTAIDNNDRLFVSGVTRSTDFPTYATGDAYLDDGLNDGLVLYNTDFFFLTFDNDGTQRWSTFYGGRDDEGYVGNGYLNDGLRCDACGNLYGAFTTNSLDVNTANPGCNSFFDDNLSHSRDAFFVKFRRSLGLHWATYFGSTDWEDGFALTINKANTLVVAGSCSNALGMPVEQFGAGYFDNTPTSQDGYLAAFHQPVFESALNYSMCNGPCNGVATIDVNAACDVGYTYLWSNGATADSINNLCSGAYQLTVTDTLNCAIDTLTFNISTGIEANALVENQSCNFGCTGTAEIVVPGISDLTYAWSNGSTSSSAVALCPGNYSVTVSALGCGSDVASVSVVLPPPLTVWLNSIQEPSEFSCAGACDGEATVMLNGGATIPFCTWSNGETGTTADSLCSGETYYVMASDSLCYTTMIQVTMPAPPPLNFYVNTVPGCSCQSFATVNVYNGTSLSFLWSNGETGDTMTDCAGTYSVTITDSICGTAEDNFNLTAYQPPVISYYQTDNPPCPACSVSAWPVLVFPSPTTYVWSTGETNTATNLCVDSTYYVTATNVCGDVYVDTFTVPPPVPMYAYVNSPFLTCSDSCSGKATASAAGAMFPLSFLWSNGETTGQAIALCAGETYLVTVWDACGQVDTTSYTFPFPLPLGATGTAAYPGCPGTCDAQATVSAISGGIAPYAYLWSNGVTETTAYGLCVDSTYGVTVTDDCGTTFATSVLIPHASNLDAYTGQSPSCAASCVGMANVYYSGGLPPYSFLWDNGETLMQVANACAGTNYTVTVYDACGNSDAASVIVTLDTPQVSNVVITPATCNFPCNGSALVESSGGTPPFMYYWSSGSISEIAPALCPGDTYSVIIIDPGCYIDTFTFSLPVISFDAVVTDFNNNACFDHCNGSIDLSVSGGIAPYSFLWNNGGTSEDLDSLCTGYYNVTVLDDDCAAEVLAIPINGTSVAAVDALDSMLCANDCNAVATLVFNDPDSSFTAVWSNGESGAGADSLCGGNHFVIVNDPGCYHDSISFSIGAHSYLEAEAMALNNILCFGECTGSAEVIPASGVTPYAVSWSDGSSNDLVEGLCAGVAFVSVSDGIGCVFVDSVFINQPDTLIIAYETTSTHCQFPDGSIVTEVAGGTSPYTYVWSNGENIALLDSVAPGVYVLTVTDANGCTFQESITVISSSPPLIVTADTVIYAGASAMLTAQGAVTYSWSPSDDLSCATCFQTFAHPVVNTTYCVTGIDSLGCTDTTCIAIVVDQYCGGVHAPNAFSPNGDGLNDGFGVLPYCINEFYIAIYNRWGQKMFETHDPRAFWDGYFNGKQCEIGVYVYYAVAVDFTGRKTVKKGNVTLLR